MRLRVGDRVVVAHDVDGFFEVAVPSGTAGVIRRVKIFDSFAVEFDNGIKTILPKRWLRAAPRSSAGG